MYKINKKNIIILIIIIISLFFIATYYIYANNENTEMISYSENFIEEKNENTQTEKEKNNEKSEIIVHVAGCVVNPGIIKLKENNRI